MKLAIKKASTDVTLYVFIQASNVTTGAGLTGLAYNTADLVASYVRPLGARAALSLATQTVEGAHSDGGFVEIDSTNMPGLYRLDLPDAVCATGVNSAVVMLKGAANMSPVLLEIQLTSYDPNDAVRLGITALPNAAADAAGGLPISDAGGLDLDAQIGTDIDSILADTGTDGVLLSAGTGAKQISLSSGAVLLQATQTGVTIPTVTSITNGVTLADDAITAAKFDESTAFPVKSADTGATQIARVGADSDTLETLSDQLDAIDDYVDTEVAAIKAKTDLITTGTTLTIASAVVGSTITAHRGDTLSAALENIGALTNYSKVWFTVKRDLDDADSAAIVQIVTSTGLLYINGAAATAGNGSITISDEATGDLTIALNASETAKLSPGNYQYDIQILRSAGTPVSTLTYGEFVVAADVTKATS